MRLNRSSVGRAPISKRRGVRGSAIVETALVFIVFLTLLIGIVDVGQMLFEHVSLVERMREGLRYGVITYDATAIQNMVLYGTASPPPGATPSFNLTASMVNVARMDANTAEDRIVITLSNYPVQWFSPYIATSTTGKPIVEAQAMELGNLP
ncbi:MAG TPA: TadE/TadG family type IV pilus assembly protein [Bryobacteraceae bacterium]|nr:TadE/TadG family type IV pilus assembly protein [Bryobacteraceae bacterium]